VKGHALDLKRWRCSICRYPVRLLAAPDPWLRESAALALLLMLNSSGCCGASALGRCSNPPARHRVVPTPRSVWMDVCYGCCRRSWFCVPCDAALRCGCSAVGAFWCARELQRALCTCAG
jgi:hypothetical protein